MALPPNGTVSNEADFATLLDHFARAPEVTVDTETTGLDFTRDYIIGVAVATEAGRWYMPFRHSEGANLDRSKLGMLGTLLHSRPRIYGYNYKFDAQFFTADDVPLAPMGTVLDPMFAGHLLDENTYSKLETRARLYKLGSDEDESRLVDAIVTKLGVPRKDAKGYMLAIDPSIVGPYACNDVALTRELARFYEPHLERYGLTSIWREVCEYAEAVTRMELNGMAIDAAYCEEQIALSDERVSATREEIYAMAGGVLNVNSPKQLCRWLNLPTSAKEDLAWALQAHPERKDIQALLEFRHYQTAAQTYYQAFLDSMTPYGVLHPNLNLIGTVSGRPSCKRPNLLNVPRNSPTYQVRNAFAASEGHTMIELDFSQAEMKIGAWYAGETEFLATLTAGHDAHAATASKMKITRAMAKNVNFSYLYGIGAKSFSRKYLVSEDKASEILEEYGRIYPGFRRVLQDTRKQAEQAGYVKMWTGRMRRFNCFRQWCKCYNPAGGPKLDGKIVAESAHPKDALNNIVQGGVSEIIRHAIVGITKGMPWARLLLTVYDSIILEVPEDRVDEAVGTATAIMLQNTGPFPMSVDAKVGQRWGSLVAANRGARG